MAPVERKLLVLTMIGYMKSGLNEDELCENQVNKHSRLVCDLMAKYGVTRYEITHNTKKTRGELSKLFDPRFVEFSDHDFIVRIVFPDVETFLKLKADPFYIERVSQDHLNFADQKMKTKMTLGYLHEIINEGQVIPLADPNANQCAINNEIFVDGTFQQKK